MNNSEIGIIITNDEMEDELDIPFEIPELPRGTQLTLSLMSNWGDSNYIGLNAVEIFTKNGTRASVDKITSTASNSVGNLQSILVESFTSTDGQQMWCAPADERPVEICLQFREEEAIAMVRIWNYNESRVHAQRGVRRMIISLDDVPIFRGEIKCAYATDAVDYEPMGDTVLFTTEESILEEIARNDVCLIHDIARTASTFDLREQNEANLFPLTPHRPITGEKIEIHEPRPRSQNSMRECTKHTHYAGSEVKAKVLHIELVANWGSPDSIGLTGIEVLGHGSMPISLLGCQVTVSNGDPGVERLINGRNLSRSPLDMWLTSFDPDRPPTITLHFATPQILTGVSIWNYNASPEMSYAGVRVAKFFVNSKLILGNAMLRKAPGYVFFDFVQDVPFSRTTLTKPNPPRPMTHSIDGFIFQLRLLSTWGDEFYIGLNGIELRDRKDRIIPLLPQNLAAFPESINILPMVESDPRTSENLIDGKNDMNSPEHMWLTPLLPNRCARVFFIFDEPTFVSKITIYNYRKTPERGVRHVSVSVDDLIVFSGEVPPSTVDRTGILEVSMRED